MLSNLRRAVAWVAYRLIRGYWWIRRPVILGVRVLVIRDDRVLLLRHSYREGWFLPGGTPEAGESLAVTARREAREETGVKVDEVKPLGIYSALDGPESDHVSVFTAENQSLGAVQEGDRLETDGDSEVAEAGWFPVAQLPRATSNQTQWILRDWHHGRTSTYRVIAEP